VNGESLAAVVVDDDADVRALLCRFLEDTGRVAVVGQAGNGLDAIDVVAETVPDVVLMDVRMPVMDGLEALPRVRATAPRSPIAAPGRRARRRTWCRDR
jgi:CheY-like chemotaxis protein